MAANSPTRAICCAMCSASLAASVYALGTSAWGRCYSFAKPTINNRCLRIPDDWNRRLCRENDSALPFDG
jgi:hypothetical protein